MYLELLLYLLRSLFRYLLRKLRRQLHRWMFQHLQQLLCRMHRLPFDLRRQLCQLRFYLSGKLRERLSEPVLCRLHRAVHQKLL